MKILLTGATGFLGKYILDRLEHEPFEITAFGRNREIGARLEARPNVTFMCGRLENPEETAAACRGQDYVIHAGALSSAWGKWEDFYGANVTGTENMIRGCLQNGVRRMVYLSSPSIYTAERDRFDIGEQDYDPENRLNHYIRTKILAEERLRGAMREGLDAVILRPRALIGIGDPSIIPRLLKVNERIGIPITRKQDHLMDVTCVENVAHAVCLALFAANPETRVYNITNGMPMRFRELITLFTDKIGTRARFRHIPYGLLKTAAASIEGIYRLFKIEKEPVLTRYTLNLLRFSQTLDIGAARRELQYAPVKSIEEGIADYAAWWNENQKGPAV